MATAAALSLLLLFADPRELFEQAMAAQRKGDLKEAARLLDAAAQAAPKNFAVLGNLGALRAQLGDYDGALAAYRQALAVNPGAARLHLNIGVAQVRRSRFAEALAALDRFLAAEPANAQGRQLRALCLFQLARFAEAAAAYQQLAGSEGEPLAALYGWGQALLKHDDRRGAERVFERLFARHGATPEAALLEAQMLMAENRLDEALKKLDGLRLPGAGLWRGITLEGLGRAAEARTAYLAEFNATGDLVAAYALGVLAGKEGNEREALQWLDRAQPIDGAQHNVAYHRGRALLRLGNAAAAVAPLEASARRDPQSVPDRYLLLQAYQKLGRKTEAHRVTGEIRVLREKELRKDQSTVERGAPRKQP